jgi:dihydroneopterin aldolase
MTAAAQPPARIVVKLGGSLARDAALGHWLRELADSRSARFVVVPGGGPFADAVRDAQRLWRFDDAIAHAMAVEAMDQFGRVLCAIEAGSVPCTTLRQIEQAWAGGHLPVWLPSNLMAGDLSLARTWDVTSDTLAAWLAWTLRADGLLLVKSCEIPATCDPARLAAAGVVDLALPDFLARSPTAFQVVQKNGWRDLSQFITRFKCRV